MYPMQPGSDGKPWALCSRCWLDGVRPMNAPKAVPTDEAPVISPITRQPHVPTPVEAAAEPAKRKKRKTG